MFFRRRRNQSAAQLALDLWSPLPAVKSESLDDAVRDGMAFASDRLPLKRAVQIKWKSYPVTAGRAYLQESVICLSRRLLTTYERVLDTVLHEHAHLYVFENYGPRVAPHGDEWRAAMQALGLLPKVTHAYECDRKTRSKPYVCSCERCGFELRRARPLKRNRVYHHIGCGGRIRYRRKED